MSAALTRAKLVPFDARGTETQEDAAIAFDFNPETLTLSVTAGEQSDKGRKGKQQRQNVAASSATLSFEAIFDSTRPRDGNQDKLPDDKLDVRLRTRQIAALIDVADGGTENAPRRVQFRWGRLIFNGTLTEHGETFDFFSPSGVPLRSKVRVKLTEQDFRYEVDASERAARAITGGAAGGLRAAASISGSADLFSASASFGLGISGGLSLGVSASFSAGFSAGVSLDAGVKLSAELGVSADLGFSAGAGVSLGADTALDVFGAAALPNAAPVAGAKAPPAPLPAPGRPPTSFAPDGPAPGSRAAGVAANVTAIRAIGAPEPPPQRAAAIAPAAPVLPVRGSPPPALPRVPAPALRILPSDTGGVRRPRWETLGPFAAGASRHAAGCGCGCGCCGGTH